MAKYTELYSEYLASGGAVPTAAFAEVSDDFEDLFTAYYCDREIGVETEELFAIKLNLRASMVCPLYKARIAAYDGVLGKVGAASKVRTFNAGAQSGDVTVLPINSISAQPNSKTSTAAYTNTETIEGETTDEALRLEEFYRKKVHDVKLQCLKEFENLFMRVY